MWWWITFDTECRMQLVTLYQYYICILQYGCTFNNSQYMAIKSAVECACEPYIHPRIILLHGPPGTGKTHTIIGLIQSFFKVRMDVQQIQKGRGILFNRPMEHLKVGSKRPAFSSNQKLDTQNISSTTQKKPVAYHVYVHI